MIYDTHDINRFRETTKKRARSMPGVMSPSFRCRVCKDTKPTAGRKPMVKGCKVAGYKCKECADGRQRHD